MSRRRKPEARCSLCRMRRELCLCSLIAECRNSLVAKTRVVIVMHHREEKLSTNTGRLAQLVWPLCEIRLRGLPGRPLQTEGILEDSRQPLFLYPSAGAVALTPEFVASLPKPVTLIVPDGSWRQAAKVANREEFLKDVPHVSLSEGPETEYRLRRESKMGGLATFEAISRVLGILEGPPTQAKLEALLREMVRRTLLSRGMSDQIF